MKNRSEKFTFSLVSPDEIFLDSENIPGFNREQFEGRVEQALKSRVFVFFGVIFFLVGAVLAAKVFDLQVAKGEDYFKRSEKNHLSLTPLNAERGLIYDRNGKTLAWNDPAFYLVLNKEVLAQEELKSELESFLSYMEKEKPESKMLKLSQYEEARISDKDVVAGIFYDWSEVGQLKREWPDLRLRIEAVSLRNYSDKAGLAHLLGYLGYPTVEELKAGSVLVAEEMIGKSGVEKECDSLLRGETGYKVVEIDSLGNVFSEYIRDNPSRGGNIKLTVDLDLQSKMHEIIAGIVEERGFSGGAGVMLDVNTGEILSITSYPEFSPSLMTKGRPVEDLNKTLNDKRLPFLNRAVSGLYAPGSVVKPMVAIAALNEKTVSPLKQVFSSGSITVPNIYNPDKPSVFGDWKAHGWVDMRRALAVSSDVYFYSIGGGYGDVKGLGITKMKKYFSAFGLGSLTGVGLPSESAGNIPGPEEKTGEDGDIWRLGDTYHASIGQGNFQVTPVQMAMVVTAIAKNGKVPAPSLVLDGGCFSKTEDREITVDDKPIPEENYRVIKEGMRMVVLEGTAVGLSGLPVNVAAKTGTAEIGSVKKLVNSWVMAYWPYENPKYALVIMFEKGSSKNLIGGVSASRQIFDWMVLNKPEYIKN